MGKIWNSINDGIRCPGFGQLVRIFPISLFICLLGCNSERIKENSPFTSGAKAYWIHDQRPLPEYDSLFYLDHPAPIFRKELQLEQRIDKAILLITAAGYYQASVNGQRVGNAVLDPAWTDFSKRIYYSEYDITSMLREGDNCLGVKLGNGFYNPLPMRKWGHRNMRQDLAEVGKPTCIAKLILTYENGQNEEIVTDDSWTYTYGPLVKNSVYLGVVYDAGREIPSWDMPSFDDAGWQTAVIGNGPSGQIQPSFFPPVEITKKIKPMEIREIHPGVWVVDMGVNFTGTYQIQLSGNNGDTVNFRFGERIYEDGSLNPMTSVIGQIKKYGVGGPGSPDTAWQTDRYIFGDQAEVLFQPDFTYHTYRYMEITGLKSAPEIGDVTGLFFHSNVPNTNRFTCSSELLSEIQTMTERTFLANLISVQSDCPAREKFGYGGDINATSESFIYNFDMQDFYRKTIYDWIDAMVDTGFVDTAPFVGIQYCGISWESAFLITQYYLYLYYNDVDIIRELYELDKQWMEKVARLHPEGIVNQGLSDHESLEPVPVQLTGTAHYLQCARIMTTFASVMGDNKMKVEYSNLANHLEELIRTQYWDQPVGDSINKQTLFATLLYHEIIPTDELEAAKDSLLHAVKNGPAGHFNTGIFGTKYVLEALSKYTSPDEVFEIVNSTAYPGWGHMIDRGATTIWETWKESDNIYSNCHPMFGSVTEWYYRWLAGIRPIEEHPGFQEFTLAPNTPRDLEVVHCTYHTPSGPIISNWERVAPNQYRYEFTIPEESTAHVQLDTQDGRVLILFNGQADIENLQTGAFKLTSGDYVIEVLQQEL